MVSLSEAQIAEWISPLLWPFLRILAVFSAAPVLSSRAFPLRARIGLSLLMALAIQGAIGEQTVISVSSDNALGVAIQQVAIGLSVGLAVRVVFASIELAGEVIGFQMGLNFAAFFDPSLNSQSSAVARFYGQMAALLFVVFNGHIIVLMAVVRSFQSFPIDQNFLEALKKIKLQEMGAELFSSALWIALPMIGMLMFVNLALGIVSRVAPQMNIYSIGFPITLSAGLIGMAVTLPLLDQPFVALMEHAMVLFGGR